MAKRIGAMLAALLGLVLGFGYFSGMIATERASADVEWQMANGVNIPGNDIVSYALAVPDPAFCRQACDQNAQCVGYTFVKPGIQGPNAMCWLKGALGQGQRDPNTISGIKSNAGGPAPGGARVEASMSLGYNLAGSDIASMQLARGDPSLCQQACDGNGQCVAWTFVKPGVQGSNAMCWLKGAVPAASADDSVISGLRLAALPAGGGAVGGVGAGGGGETGWGVWASASGGNWADPCAIQYNAAQLAGNRYDGNSGYRRVRTRATQPEADLDIDHFGRYNRDQPDGVVKMVPCDDDTAIAGGDGGAGGGGAGGPGAGQAGQWMTGNFSTSEGEMTLSPGGGNYNQDSGRIIVTRIDGATMEGRWQESSSARQCPDGSYSGRIRFTFTPTGFSGVWGYCDDEPSGSWTGTKR